MNPYNKSIDQLLTEFSTTASGLTTAQVEKSKEKYGKNVLPEAKSKSYIVLFIDQFKSAVIYILLAAAIVVMLLNDYSDAIIILIVLVLNALVGMYQEGRAQNTFLALKKLASAQALILRDQQEILVSDSEVVVGDILILAEGDKVVADARLMEVKELRIDESILTGEAEPTTKSIDATDAENLEVFEQKNMLFKGTNIAAGAGRALVVSVGEKTFIGSFSKKLESLDTDVPLKENIKSLSRIIIYVVMVLSVLVFFIGILKGFTTVEMLKTVIAMAVSAIPEGLPVTVTLVLATGVHRMSKRNALIKRLQAVEALGQATIVATDKTGTLTLNQMQIERVFVLGSQKKEYEITGHGYEPIGEFKHITSGGLLDMSNTASKIISHVIDPKLHNELSELLRISACVSGGTIALDSEKQMWMRVSGDPTEVAFTVLAQKAGFNRTKLLDEFPISYEFPFSSATKYHATIHKEGTDHLMAVAGAPEVLLSESNTIYKLGGAHTISDLDRTSIMNQVECWSKQGYRVIAIAEKQIQARSTEAQSLVSQNGLSGSEEPSAEDLFSELCFVGIVAISDAIRPEIYEAVKLAQSAGVKVVMITGDFAETAKAIALRAGIYNHGDLVITGAEMDGLAEERLLEMVPKATVFARVSPDHKLKIINLYRKHKEIIAMTGDGVNDALSLASADLGIAMGKNGTEVAKESADLILLDDNFATIVAAIEEGRIIYRTIKKVVTYLLATSVGEIAAIAGAISLGFPLPISPSQIIWLNLVTDGFLVLALAMEFHRGGVMKGKYSHSKWIIDSRMLVRMVLVALVMMTTALITIERYLPYGEAYAMTVTLTLLAIIQWLNAWNSRSERTSIFRLPFFSNMYLIYATGTVIVLQILAVYWKPLQLLLQTVSITAADWVFVTILSLTIVLVEEIRKIVSNLFSKD